MTLNVVGTVSEIVIYPIKSFAGIKVNRALIHKYGLSYAANPSVIDRKWMCIDLNANGSFQTQRQLPKMALIKPSIDGDHIVLEAPNTTPIRFPIKAPTNNKINSRQFI